MGILNGPIDMGPRKRTAYKAIAARPGLALVHRASSTAGVLVVPRGAVVVLRDATGRDHSFPARDGVFAHDGKPVALRTPTGVERPEGPRERTASGSISVGPMPARMARASRIFVEGLHDAELIERCVWGDDLRHEGVVVEYMQGMDDLGNVVRSFGPGPNRKLGILLDHLIDGTKEQRAAKAIDHPDVLITGHPYVDVWQAVKPKVLGLSAWPDVPRGVPWKDGICAALGWKGTTGEAWKAILAKVDRFTDLEPPLVGAVEQLIDFVAPPEG